MAAGKSNTSTSSAAAVPLPLIYRLFFLTIEPFSALVGAYFAHFQPAEYLRLTTYPPSVTTSLPAPQPSPTTRIVLSQLANLYLLFALNEALVLRATADRRVWRALLFGLLVADVGHLYSVWGLWTAGKAVYWDVGGWNAMDWGNVGFVYVGMSMRVAFLMGVGMGEGSGRGKRKGAGRGKKGD
ncbi:MAG: hypothetical protein M4579_007111 [Chaenotheca gracillima]|nr:MAG: hypothetical protein M4579_007111 [Chaenotheca gracillima]